MLNTKLGRKFFISIYTLSVLFLMMWYAKIPSDDFRFLTMMIIGSYLGGNVVQKYVEAKKDTGV